MSHLPNDIWLHIIGFLEGDDLCRFMWLSGSIRIRNLASNWASFSVKVASKPNGSKQGPWKFISSLTRTTSLRLFTGSNARMNSGTFTYPSPSSLELASLPRTLTSFIMDNSICALHPKTLGDLPEGLLTLHAYVLFPTDSTYCLPSTSLPHANTTILKWPQNITSLKLYYPHAYMLKPIDSTLLATLPASLVKLDFSAFYVYLPFIDGSPDPSPLLPQLIKLKELYIIDTCSCRHLLRLPEGIESVSLWTHAPSVFFGTLPTTTKTFTIVPRRPTEDHIAAPTLVEIALARLPRGLVELNIPKFPLVSSLLTLQASIPPFLTTLRTQYINLACLRSLPSSLTELDAEVHDNASYGLASKDFPEAFDFSLDTHLPNLRTIILRPGSPLDLPSHMAEHLPFSSLTHINIHRATIPPSFWKSLNPQLKHLKILSRLDSTFTLEHFKSLPRSLEYLDLWPPRQKSSNSFQLTDEAITFLPRGITNLTLYEADLLTDACVKDLPRTLNSLYLYPNANWTDAIVHDLPRQLTFFGGDNSVHLSNLALHSLHPMRTMLKLQRKQSAIAMTSHNAHKTPNE